MAKGTKYTEADLIALGLVRRDDGTWHKPIVKSPYIKQQEAVNEGLIPREPVTETPDFQYQLKTEWFIRGNVVPKKNSRQTFVRNGKIINIPSKAHKEYVTSTKMQYEVFGREFRKAVEVLSLPYPLRIEFAFVRSTKHRSDFTNLVQSVEDLMTEHGWIVDDDLLHLLPFPAPVQFDKNSAGVRIRLLK